MDSAGSPRSNVLLPVLLLPGLWVLWRRGGRALGAARLVLLLHPLGMALLAPYRGPGVPGGPLLDSPPAARHRGGGERGRPARRGRRARPALVGAAGCALLLLGLARPLGAGATRYAWAVQNIDAMQVQPRAVGRARTRRPDARLALNDVGAIAYSRGARSWT